VRPGPSDDHEYYCASYYNIDHALDPFPMVAPFAPDGWETPPTNIRARHFRDWNVHDLEHYLDNPAVHVPLLRKLAGRRVVGRADERDAVANYAQFDFDEEPDGDVKLILTDLGKVVTRAQAAQKAADYLNTFVEFFNLADHLRGILDEE
jgi:hypothetical protein